jgi:hypothetical protein
MLKTNFIGAIILLAAMAVTGDLFACVDFSMRNPMVNINLVGCAVTLFVAVYCMTKYVPCVFCVRPKFHMLSFNKDVYDIKFATGIEPSISISDS